MLGPGQFYPPGPNPQGQMHPGAYGYPPQSSGHAAPQQQNMYQNNQFNPQGQNGQPSIPPASTPQAPGTYINSPQNTVNGNNAYNGYSAQNSGPAMYQPPGLMQSGPSQFHPPGPNFNQKPPSPQNYQQTAPGSYQASSSPAPPQVSTAQSGPYVPTGALNPGPFAPTPQTSHSGTFAPGGTGTAPQYGRPPSVGVPPTSAPNNQFSQHPQMNHFTPGGLPQGPLSQGMSPAPGTGSQVLPPPSGLHSHGMPPPSGLQSQGMPPPSGLQNQGMPPPSGLQSQGMPPPSGLQNQGMPPPSGLPNQGMPPPPGLPNQGMPPGMQSHGMPPQPGPQGPGMPSALGGFQQQGYPGGGMAPQAPRQRLDPENLPNAVQVIENDREKNTGVFNTSVKGQAPPLVTTEFVTEDAGCSGPRYIRAVSYTWPNSADMVKSAGFPISVVIQPMAQQHLDERPLPLVNTGDLGPVRCRRCKAYMCPFMQFIDGGRRFQCKFCDSITDVPNEYFAHLDHTGARYDRYERPELHLGSFEYTATKDYCSQQKLPQAPAYVFMIDVSHNAIQSGMVQTLCTQLKNVVLKLLPKDSDQNEPEIRVAFATYSTSLQFYNLHPSLAQPQAFVVTDVKDVFVPLVDGFMVKVSESSHLIMTLLDMIPQLYADTKEAETVLGPVIEAGLDAMKASERCGKLFVFHSSLPTFTAPGKLEIRDERKVRGTAKEKQFLQPADNYYTKVAQDCVAAGCGIDLFLFPNGYIDVATLSELPRVTGGSLYRYPYFRAEQNGIAFAEDLRRAVMKPQGFDSIMRVRSSTGLQPINHYGNFNMTNSRDIEMGSCDSDKAMVVELKHDDKLSPDVGAYLQVALLYTTVGGRRRLRILNFAANVSTILMDVFRGCDLDSLLNLMSKQAVQMSVTDGPSAIREKFTTQVAQMLACYRKNCVSQSPDSSAQLILPECMKCLPLYVNSLIKHDCFQTGLDLQMDDRAFLLFTLNSLSVSASQVFFYPRLFPVHRFDPAADSHRQVPVCVRLSHDRLEENGVYILENGLDIWIWIGEAQGAETVQKLCGGAMGGAPGVQIVDVTKVSELAEFDNQLSQLVRQLVNFIRNERDRHLRLRLVVQKKQIDGIEAVLLRQLVEDKTNGVSYVDYLCHLHSEIRQLLA